MLKGLQFSPIIELGHIVQALIMLATVGGWAIVGYETVQKQLDFQQSQTELLKQRVLTNETALSDVRDTLRNSVNDTRTRLDRIFDQLSDLKASVAAGQANREITRSPHR